MVTVLSIVQSSWFNSNLLAILVGISYWLWIFAEITNNIISRVNKGGTKKDKGSYWIVVIGLFASIGMSFIFRYNNIGAFKDNSLQSVGFSLVILGIIIREWAVFTLGKGFTVKVHAQERGKLVTKGPYRIIRHPSYTGSFLTIIGLPLAFGTWAGLIMILIISIPAFIYRIRIEEKILAEVYGRDYGDYIKRTWRLVPGIY